MSRKVIYNKSKTYVLPLLAEVIGIDKKFFKYLKNTYIFDKAGKYENCIFIEHIFSFRNPEFTKYEHKLTDNNYFVDLVDVSPEKVIYIFKIPDEYLPEYNLFIQGKYSCYKKDAKELILVFFNEMYKGNPNAINFLVKVERILNKDPILKKELEAQLKIRLNSDAELTDIIKLQDETIELKQNENTI